MFVDANAQEFEGNTVEEAIDKAEKAFGVPRETRTYGQNYRCM